MTQDLVVVLEGCIVLIVAPGMISDPPCQAQQGRADDALETLDRLFLFPVGQLLCCCSSCGSGRFRCCCGCSFVVSFLLLLLLLLLNRAKRAACMAEARPYPSTHATYSITPTKRSRRRHRFCCCRCPYTGPRCGSAHQRHRQDARSKPSREALCLCRRCSVTSWW